MVWDSISRTDNFCCLHSCLLWEAWDDGQFEKLNEATPHGYVAGETWGNLFFAIHIALAAIITIGGPIQLIPKVRNRFPRFHRINGRTYIFSAFLISIAGLYLAWIRGMVGGLEGALFISANALIIMISAFFAVKHAMAANFAVHYKWAIRLFLAMSGVWFFRVFLMLWIAINQGPVGFDPETFQGPALNVLYVLVYICPVFILELYFLSQKRKTQTGMISMSVFLLLLTLGMAVGIFVAFQGMWLPQIIS